MIQFHVKIDDDDDDDDDDDVASILIKIDTLPLVITFKFLQGLWQFCTYQIHHFCHYGISGHN